MNTQKGFITILVLAIGLLGIGGGIYYFHINSQKTPSVLNNTGDENIDNEVTTETVKIEGIQEYTTEIYSQKEVAVTNKETTGKIEDSNTTTKNSLIDTNLKTSTTLTLSDPWEIIDKLKSYSKNRDKIGFDTLIHNPEKMSCGNKDECESMFKFLDVMLFNTLDKNDYVERWEDSRQIILVSKYMSINNTDEKLGSINYLFFSKNNDGNLKFIGNSSSVLGFSKKGTNRSDSELEAEIQVAIADADKDGLSDEKERCVGLGEFQTDCKISDPAKRDTDGDGWWDGIQAKF